MTHLCKRLAFSVYPILNIAAYRFVDIADASELRASLHSKTDALALKGTILVAPEGLNLFLAGAPESVSAFFDDLQRDARLAGLTLKESWSAEVPFARLKVKLKREIIAFRRDGVDPLKAPAPSVAPPTLARWLAQGHDDEGKRVLMLDTRNREEVALGTFDGALCLPIGFAQKASAMCANWRAASWRTSSRWGPPDIPAAALCSTSAWLWARLFCPSRHDVEDYSPRFGLPLKPPGLNPPGFGPKRLNGAASSSPAASFSASYGRSCKA